MILYHKKRKKKMKDAEKVRKTAGKTFSPRDLQRDRAERNDVRPDQ